MSQKLLDINKINDIDKINKYFDFNGYLNDIDFSNNVNNQISEKKNDSNCPSCNSDTLVEDNSLGIIVCTNPNCGQVVDTILDYNPEWKKFDGDDTVGRCSMPINVHLPQSSLGTNISGMGRIKTLHIWNHMPYKERSLNKEFKKIHEICQKANILKCIEEDARNMYATASKCKHTNGKNAGKYVIIRGVNRISISAGCLFYACLKKGMTRTSKEIASLYGIKDADLHKGCKNLSKFLSQMKMRMKIGTSKPEHFVKRYCNELKIKDIYSDEAVKISKNIDKLNLASFHTPYSLAAASILLMAELNNIRSITKKKLSAKFSISEITISDTYKELVKCKYILINDELTDEIMTKFDEDMKKEETPPEVLERMKKFGINIESTTQNINSENTNTKDHSNIDEEEYDNYIDDVEGIREYYNEKLANSEEMINKLKKPKLNIKDDLILMRESYLLLNCLNKELKQIFNSM